MTDQKSMPEDGPDNPGPMDPHDRLSRVDPYITNQMMTDDFIGQVIQIVAPSKLHIDIADPLGKDRDLMTVREGNVTVTFEGVSVDGFEFSATRTGLTVGSTLRAIREALRQESGQ
jgi:hypothetical protein